MRSVVTCDGCVREPAEHQVFSLPITNLDGSQSTMQEIVGQSLSWATAGEAACEECHSLVSTRQEIAQSLPKLLILEAHRDHAESNPGSVALQSFNMQTPSPSSAEVRMRLVASVHYDGDGHAGHWFSVVYGDEDAVTAIINDAEIVKLEESFHTRPDLDVTWSLAVFRREERHEDQASTQRVRPQEPGISTAGPEQQQTSHVDPDDAGQEAHEAREAAAAHAGTSNPSPTGDAALEASTFIVLGDHEIISVDADPDARGAEAEEEESHQVSFTAEAEF